MKKIGIFLSANPHDGGSYQYTQSLLQAALSLPRNRYELIFAYGSPHWESWIPGDLFRVVRLANEGLMWQCFNSRRFLLLTGFPSSFWRKYCPFLISDVRKIMQEKCDLWIFPDQVTWSYILPVRSLSVIHDLMHRYENRFPEVSGFLTYRQREKHYKDVCLYSEGILVDSDVGKAHVLESYKIDEKIIHVLPYVAPLYLDKEKSHLNTLQYDLPPKFFFYPAQFWKHKNHEILIRAIESVLHKIPDMKMVFAGSPKNNYEEVKTIVSKLSLSDHIIFIGYIPDQDMASIYRRARALVMPTYFGPTNIPPLEAFSSGCPVAISGIYGIPEQVGNAALLFNPSNRIEIADVLYRLWTDDNLCNELSQRGLQQYKLWNQHHFNERFLAIMEYITGNFFYYT